MAPKHTRVMPRGLSLGIVSTLVGAMVVMAQGSPALALDPAVPPAPNPNLAPSCGIDVALVLDGSGSIAQFGAVDEVEDAATAFLASFVATDTNAGIVIFNQNAPKAGTLAINLTPVTADSTGPGGAHTDVLDTYGSLDFTNWEAPLQYAANPILATGNRPDKPDLVVFVTDGEPNTAAVAGVITNDVPGFPAAVGPAITAANALKAGGAHVLAVGVGQAFQNTAQGADRRDALKFVSGTDAYDPTGTFGSTTFSASTTDVIFESDFDNLEASLTQIATELCGGTLIITKEASTPGDPTNFQPAAGWDFTATPSSPASAYSWVLPDTAPAPSKTVTTNAAGAATFQWDVTNPAAWTPAIGVVETTKTGFEMLEPECEGSGSNVPVTGFDSTTGAFTVPVGPTATVTCLVRNQAEPTPPPPDVSIVKTNDPTVDEPVAIGDTITYELTASTDAPLDNLTVSDIMPGTDPDFPDSASVTYVPGSAVCAPATCTIAFDDTTQTLTADFGAVEAGDYTVTFDVTVAVQEVPVGGTDGGLITNQGTVTYTPPGGPPAPPVPSNPVENPIILVTLVGNSSSSCISDTPFFDFESTGWFAGESVTLNILDRDQNPYETRQLVADANGIVRGPLLWPGFSVDPVTNVKVYPPASLRPIYIFLNGSPVTDTVQVAYPPASAKCDAGLTLVKSNSPSGSVAFGSTITYTLTVGVPAGGSFNQDGVVVSDFIPGYDPARPTSGKTTYVAGSGACLDPGTPGIGTCVVTFDEATKKLSWALGSMQPGESRRLTFRVTVDASTTSPVQVLNAAVVLSDYWPGTDSNVVTNTALIPTVAGSVIPGTLSSTGAASLIPAGSAALLLLTSGVAMVAVTSRRRNWRT